MSVEAAATFIARWANASPSERANSQLFLSELCDLLGVAHPDPTRDNGYGFEYGVTQQVPDGSPTRGRIDLYKRGCFVLESKQFQAAKAKESEVEKSARQLGLEMREGFSNWRIML
jgi:hypothetical protein